MADITKLPILTSATDGTYLLAVDNEVAKRLPFPGAGQLRGNSGYTGSTGYTGSRGLPSTVPGYTGSHGYIGSFGYTGSSGYAVDRGYTGSAGTVGSPGPNNIINASTLPDSTDPTRAIEYFVGVGQAGSSQTAIVSRTNPIVFNTVMGQVGIGTISTLGTLHLKDATSPQVYFEEADNPILHKLGASGGNLTLDIDTTNSAGGSNFYISQVGSHKLAMTPNGNIGILTNTPAEALDVAGKLRISSPNIIAKSYSRIYALDDSRLYWENQRYAATVSSPTNVLYAGTRIVGDIDPSETGGVFSFDNAPVAQAGLGVWTQRLTIIENGNVGINVVRPNSLLTVNANANTANVAPYAPAALQIIGADSQPNRIVMNSFGSANYSNILGAVHAGGTAGSPSATPAGSILLTLSAGGRGTTQYLSGLARIDAISGESYTDSSGATAMRFFTTPTGSISPQLAMWMQWDGKITTGGGSIDGASDFNIRQAGTSVNPGSFSLAGSGVVAGAGTSYITMGNSDGPGAAGPVVIQSNNRQFRIGTGTSFTDRTGGTFTPNLTIDANGNLTIGGNFRLDGVLTVAGINTMNTNFSLVNTTATTVNFAGESTTLNIGSTSGTTTIGNMLKLTYSGASDSVLQIAGSDTRGGPGYQDFLRVQNTGVGATNPNKFFRVDSVGSLQIVDSAYLNTLLQLKDNGDLNIHGSNITSDQSTVNLINTNPTTTVNAFGNATTVNIGNQANGSQTIIASPTVEGVRYTQSLWNTVPTSVSAFGAATAISIGAATGSLTIANPTLTLTNGTNLNINGTNPTLASTNNGTLTLFDTNITTVSAFGNASLIEMAKTGGQTTIRSNVTINGSLTVSGTATSVLSTNSYYTDNIIELHTPPSGVYSNWAIDDGRDIGFRFHYYINGMGDENAALVLANDTKYLEWYNTGAEASTGTFYGANYGTFKTGAVYLAGNTANQGNATSGDLQVAGGAGIGGSLYVGGSINAGSGIRISGAFTTTNITDSALTSGRVTYAGAGGLLQDSSNLTFNGTSLTAVNTITGQISSIANHNTDSLQQGSTNKYFSNALARGAISVSGNLSYDSGTGVISYTTPSAVSGFTNDAHYITSSSLSVSTASASGSGSLSYNTGNGVFTFTPPNLSSYITLSSLSAGTGVSYNNSTGVISIGQSVGTSDTPTFAGLTVNGIIDVTTPNIGSTGAVRIHGNATTGFARLQIVNTAGNAEWAALKIDSTGLWQFNNDISSVGNITAYYGSSDRRLKENIQPIQSALGTVKALTGVTYDWTADYLSKITASALPNDIGLIAQDVQAILPEVVYDKGDGYLAIRYEKLTPLLIEAVKEQQAIIDQMAADIALLKSKLGL